MKTLISRTVMVCWIVASTVGGAAEPAPPFVNVIAPPEAAGNLNGNSYIAPFERTGRFQQVYDADVFFRSFSDGIHQRDCLPHRRRRRQEL